MKTAALFVVYALLIVLQSCVKDTSLPASDLPNGDFEGWSSSDELQGWTTNSCPECVPDYNSYVVQKTTEAYHGQYAAKILYNGVYTTVASNGFAVTSHPKELTGYVKCTLNQNDTVSVVVKVFKNNALVDSGKWVNITSIQQYQKFIIPISQNSVDADSVTITVTGGNKLDTNKNGSVLWIDYLCVH
ncbi:MAG TPA: hypothetical protein VG367_12455 [Mucilaginibacter sp.]|jgi:hypothetical protein|nr:hypothetical protein [Mucilaginibacter sp.]